MAVPSLESVLLLQTVTLRMLYLEKEKVCKGDTENKTHRERDRQRKRVIKRMEEVK